MFTISKSMLRRGLGLVLIAGIVTTIVVSRSANVRAEPEGNGAAAALKDVTIKRTA